MDRASLAAGDRLVAAGERVTRQRLQVANVLAAAGRQLTADQVYGSLRRQVPSIGRATVFRSLETLVDAGLARRLELDGHVYAYVACLPQHHHHLACTNCGRVEEIDEAYVRPIADRLERDMGFQVDDARLDFYGRCATCRTEESPAS
ncbi:MAG: transcriptional repressor [Chloroflexi bacterium]|nr:transcriptional repressor [Chloroflexota bacterium]